MEGGRSLGVGILHSPPSCADPDGTVRVDERFFTDLGGDRSFDDRDLARLPPSVEVLDVTHITPSSESE